MSFQQLQRARTMDLPSRDEMLRRAPSVQSFWHQNKDLFSEAWTEWEASEKDTLHPLGESLIAPKLREAINQAWADPTQEIAVKDVWEEVLPGVYMAQFLDVDRLKDLRDYLEAAWKADIPFRPPYGIALNSGGAMLDPRSEGYLAAPSFQTFYQKLVDHYMRPVARLLFPEIVGYDTQSFGFSIQYQANKDTSLQPHTDASSVTLNINMNSSEDDFSGSALNFYNQSMGMVKELTFKPGTAVIHRGSVIHAAQPITEGERSNLVLWLYGDHGQIPRHGISNDSVDAHERWTVPNTTPDAYAPF